MMVSIRSARPLDTGILKVVRPSPGGVSLTLCASIVTVPRCALRKAPPLNETPGSTLARREALISHYNHARSKGEVGWVKCAAECRVMDNSDGDEEFARPEDGDGDEELDTDDDDV